MGIYPDRLRAARLNDPDREAIAKWSDDEDDGPDPDALEPCPDGRVLCHSRANRHPVGQVEFHRPVS